MIVYVFSHSCVLQVSIIHACCGNVVQDQNIKGKSNGGFVWWSVVERCRVQRGEFRDPVLFWEQEHSAYSTRRSRWTNQGENRECLVVLTLGRWFPVQLILYTHCIFSLEPHAWSHFFVKATRVHFLIQTGSSSRKRKAAGSAESATTSNARTPMVKPSPKMQNEVMPIRVIARRHVC